MPQFPLPFPIAHAALAQCWVSCGQEVLAIRPLKVKEEGGKKLSESAETCGKPEELKTPHDTNPGARGEPFGDP